MKLGDIGWRVMLDRNKCEVFLCQLRVCYVSPKGRNCHWQEVGTKRQTIHKNRSFASPTPEDAVRDYQKMLMWESQSEYSVLSEDVALDRILAAERLLISDDAKVAADLLEENGFDGVAKSVRMARIPVSHSPGGYTAALADY